MYYLYHFGYNLGVKYLAVLAEVSITRLVLQYKTVV